MKDEHEKTVRPIIRWAGGKRRLLKKLLPILPEHCCYCEPFMGGLAVLLAKPRSKVEVVNDLNRDLVALYRNLQYHFEAFVSEIEWDLGSRATLEDFKAQTGLTEIQRCSRWFIRNKISFGGGFTSFAVSRKSGGGAGFCRRLLLENLAEFRDRMDRVVVENLSYERCLELYDSPETLFFLDPPYIDSQCNNYSGFTKEQMNDLKARIEKLRGKWILTVDDSTFNRELFSEYCIESVETRNGTVNRALFPDKVFGELIITPTTLKK